MTARTAFWARLLTLAESGRPTPCVASRTGWWTSERPADQARAAAECRTCPVLALCREYIAENPEPAGVYAGLTSLDRSPARPHRTPTKETAA